MNTIFRRVVVGPNPYPLHSFIELRKGLGPVWIVCESCRRYMQLPRGLDARDTRVTTLSCSVCGGDGPGNSRAKARRAGEACATGLSLPDPNTRQATNQRLG
jgi:LSD1 subclass zinc finger protein